MADEPKNYIPQSGMPEKHFEAFQKVAKMQQVVVLVRDTNPASKPLIKMGCPGKPMSIKFHTSQTTGVVTATTPDEVATARKLGYFVVDSDLVARGTFMQKGQAAPVEVELKLQNPFWRVERGQVIDPKLRKPLVGDYDLHSVFSPDSPGQNLAKIYDEGEVEDVTSPIVEEFRKVVNALLDQERVFHGAQDQFGGCRGGATIFLPNGNTAYLPDDQTVKDFFKWIGREPFTGRYYSDLSLPPLPSDILRIPGRSLAQQSKAQRVLRDQDVMAVLGIALGMLAQWIGDLHDQRRVVKELQTTRANEIRTILSQGQGVLIIIRMEEWRYPDFNGMRARHLLGVIVRGGPNAVTALQSWQNEPQLLRSPMQGWWAYEHYLWIDPSY